MNDPHSAVREIEQLAELYDEEFVAAAYRAILDRAPDVGGLKNYLSQVRSGVNKLQILAEMAQSAEGRSRNPTPPGFDELIKKHSVRRRTFLGRIWRPNQHQMLTLERQLRAIDNHLYLARTDLANGLSEIAESLRFIQSPNLVPADSGAHSDKGRSSTPSAVQMETRLSPKLRKTLSALKQAISARG